jgi:hypothetical protein
MINANDFNPPLHAREFEKAKAIGMWAYENFDMELTPFQVEFLVRERGATTALLFKAMYAFLVERKCVMWVAHSMQHAKSIIKEVLLYAGKISSDRPPQLGHTDRYITMMHTPRRVEFLTTVVDVRRDFHLNIRGKNLENYEIFYDLM